MRTRSFLLVILTAFVIVAAESSSGTVAAQGDTSRIAFHTWSDGKWQIDVIRADGTDRRRVSDPRYSSWSPAFSPDGRLLAFVSDRDGPGAIYTMTSIGADVRRVVEPPGKAGSLSWSPDGRLLAYSAQDQIAAGAQHAIYVVGAQGGTPRRLAEGEAPVWAPDGKRIAFNAGTQFPQIMVMDADASNARLLLRKGARQSLVDLGPLWSPDGTTILYTSIGLDKAEFGAIYLQRLDESDATRVTAGLLPCAWSPDGRRFALINGEKGKPSLSVINVDGSGLRKLADIEIDRSGDVLPRCSWAR